MISTIEEIWQARELIGPGAFQAAEEEGEDKPGPAGCDDRGPGGGSPLSNC